MPVFSHDELLCKMMAQAEKLELSLLVATSKDACTMVRTEERLRRELTRKVIHYCVMFEARRMRVFVCKYVHVV